MSCNQAACTTCVAGMEITSEVVCEGLDYGLSEICEYSLEGVGEDIFADAIAAIACGAAAGNACKYEFEANWNSEACAAMFGDDGCCGSAPTEGLCGVCPFDCAQLSNVFPYVYNDDTAGAMTAC